MKSHHCLYVILMAFILIPIRGFCLTESKKIDRYSSLEDKMTFTLKSFEDGTQIDCKFFSTSSYSYDFDIYCGELGKFGIYRGHLLFKEYHFPSSHKSKLEVLFILSETQSIGKLINHSTSSWIHSKSTLLLEKFEVSLGVKNDTYGLYLSIDFDKLSLDSR